MTEQEAVTTIVQHLCAHKDTERMIRDILAADRQHFKAELIINLLASVVAYTYHETKVYFQTNAIEFSRPDDEPPQDTTKEG